MAGHERRNDRHICKHHKLKPNIRLVKSHQSSVALKASFNLRACVCLCVRAYVWCPVTALPNGWASKLSNQALLKLYFPSSPACLCFLPPRPKLLPPFGLPKPPSAGRLVEGQESANQGRPGSPAFNSPGRLRGFVCRETERGKTEKRWHS